MAAAGLVHALRDPLIAGARLKTREALQHLLKLTEIRNGSVLAHGYRSIREDQSRAPQGTALNVLRASWGLHSPSRDVDALCRELQFIHLGGSSAAR